MTDWTPSERQREREQVRRRLDRRAGLVALTATVLTGVVLGLVIVNAPGWPTVRGTVCSGSHAQPAVPTILSGVWRSPV